MKKIENIENLPKHSIFNVLASPTHQTQEFASCPSGAELNLDHSLLYQIYADDSEYAREIFETFLAQADDNHQALKAAFEGAYWEELARLAHKIKPEFAFVGLPQVEATLAKLESLCKSAGDHVQIRSLFTEFDHFYPAAIASVKSYLSALPR